MIVVVWYKAIRNLPNSGHSHQYRCMAERAQSGHLTKTLRQVKQIEAFKVSNADKVSFRCDCANVAFQALVGNSMNNI
jgi:hypothetical protein